MHWGTLSDIQQQVRRTGQRAVAEHFLERVEQFAALNAFISVEREALTLLAEAQVALPLQGVPIAVKDLIDMANRGTTAASRLFVGRVAAYDAPVVARLRKLGGYFIGKTNLHEFAYGGSGVISAYGPVKNPWNPDHITGGSSSGSAAAIAAGLCTAAIGTDTAGSIRLPASFCGIVGFKPTYGAISTDSVIPLARSYDHVGPMTRSVDDARFLFSTLSGVELPARKREGKLRVGIPEAYFYRDLDPSVAAVIDDVLLALRAARHEILRRDFIVDEDRTLASYESYGYHKHWVEASPELYQPETLRRIQSGAKITAEAAQAAAQKLKSERENASGMFAETDVLLTPTVPILPPKLADLLQNPDTLRPTELIMLRNTRPFNVLGLPAISIPWTLSPNGMPIGIQLAAAPRRDFELLDIAEEFERLSPWAGRVPLGYE